MQNVAGAFTATNPKGDIIYRAQINAANITTVAGGTVFIDGLTSYHISGDPYGDLKALGNGIVKYNETAALNKLSSTAQITTLYGDTVIINAEYINVNGIVQSGKDQYSLTLGTSTANQIAAFKASGSASRFLVLTSPNPDFSLQFDSLQNRIVVKELRVRGGNVQLTGHILSTGGGTIRVLDGYANIQVDNSTGYDIEIERLDASRRGAGTLLLADKAERHNNRSGRHVVR